MGKVMDKRYKKGDAALPQYHPPGHPYRTIIGVIRTCNFDVYISMSYNSY